MEVMNGDVEKDGSLVAPLTSMSDLATCNFLPHTGLSQS